MRTIVIALMLVMSLVVLTDKATAQSRTEKFPYDAIIADDEVYARSGPGKQYYPTSRLRKGDHVTVIRHDHGGWFMIEPPPGSFAWVRQEFVNREGDRGIITGDSQIVAWVGTSFGDDHFVESRRLQPGEAVDIIGEKTLRDERGEVAYFRIKSPKGHWRWISGAKVVTSDKQLTAANTRGDDFPSYDKNSEKVGRDPEVSRVDMASLEPSGNDAGTADNKSVPVPKEFGRRPAPTPKDLEEDDAIPNPQTPANRQSGTPTSLVTMDASGQQQLAAIDEQMKEMLQRNTRDWDFAPIEAELQALQAQESTSTGAARRLASLGKYKRIKADYDDFAGIMDKTNRRDAELAAAAQRGNPSVTPSRASPAPRPQTSPSPINRATTPGGLAAPTRSVPNNSPAKNRFGGAGIIKRSGSNQAGVPQYVLVHPSGQRLAYLQGEGVDLSKYVGESMGLEGVRYYRPELKSDFMIVKSLQPVKLRP